MVEDGASSHEIDYSAIVLEILKGIKIALLVQELR